MFLRFTRELCFVKFIVVPVLTKFLICFKSLNNVVLSKIVLYGMLNLIEGIKIYTQKNRSCVRQRDIHHLSYIQF